MADDRRTPLYDWHVAHGARMVSFAGWSLPIQYPTGIIREHHACRERAALFDVSHMGIVRIAGDTDQSAKALESVLSGDLQGQRSGLAKYTLLMTPEGGIVDDLMAMRHDADWYLVLNAARTADDLAVLDAALPAGHRPVLLEEQALLALQGPKAAEVLARHLPEVVDLKFRESREVFVDGQPGRVARLGYTGEDGFEIELAAAVAAEFASRLTAAGDVTPAGLGARDSLRLEAGLCLYGHEIDTTTSPVAANLAWAINKRRREAADFPGAGRILEEMAKGTPEKLVGLTLDGRMPAREGAPILHGHGDQARRVGRVTSGGFAPTVGAPVALGYVERALAEPGTGLRCQVRRHEIDARVTPLPFVPHHYHR
ncbi:MAG: glycine cleavage system aminomethyltransferase GcvT [Alphaproteobacteria bacterium]